MIYEHVNSKGTTYYLNSTKVTLRCGYVQTLYFFSKEVRASGCPLPDDKYVIESKNGFLFVKKKV